MSSSTSLLQQQQIALLQVFEFIEFPIKTVDARTVESVEKLLRGIGTLPKGAIFSTFNSKHMAEAKKLYDVLKGAKDFDNFLLLALSAREIVNEVLLVYAVSQAILDCNFCHGFLIPPIEEIFPDKFIPAETLNKAIMTYLQNPSIAEIYIPIDETSLLRNPEHRLAYFREDIGINSHHWHWHLVFPYNGAPKDRKGELFYYMHQQMCARYDCERLSVGLERVVPFYDFDDILEGYSPHLKSLQNGTHNGSRPEGLFLKEVNHLRRWFERIMEAIHQGALIDKEGNKVVLDVEKGIVFLGDVIEASNSSPNLEFYGNFHNEFHNSLAQVHDPKEIFKELPGVIGEPITAVRDPVFFRLHRFLDDLFVEHKKTLPLYERKELDFPGIQVQSIETIDEQQKNVIFTYMSKSVLELNHAIPVKSSIKVEYQHLDHNIFDYEIIVQNTSVTKVATVRIFLGPLYDETGRLFHLSELRRYFIELDKFKEILQKGTNIINRKSSESSVTRSHIALFKELRENNKTSGKAVTDPYCNCGWPEHMLIPRGTYQGMDFLLFVMLTDEKDDSVEAFKNEDACEDSSSYCGVKNEKYPDKKPMGFPFDRIISADTNINNFLTNNMLTTNIKIKFLGSKLKLSTP